MAGYFAGVGIKRLIMYKFLLVFLSLIFLFGCTEEDIKKDLPDEKIANENLLIVGEGGPSGAMFIKAAETFRKEQGGIIYEVHSGDEFISAIKDFVQQYGKIKHLAYFGHGNHIGLYVNQSPNVNGGLYANDVDQNKNYLSASIFELPPDIFAKYGWIKFNGCNVAKGFPEADNLAQRFSNYFDVDSVAPMGPTEFSSQANVVDPIPNSNYLDPNFSGDVYMVPTYSDQGFVIVKPWALSESDFVDVRKGEKFEEGVTELFDRGLDLNFEDKRFWPYKNISYKEARKFCELIVSNEEKCVLSGEGTIRNLQALKLLVDASGVEVGYSKPWYNSYISWANKNNLLTDDFVNKKWYTRGEMAQLTWNFLKFFEK